MAPVVTKLASWQFCGFSDCHITMRSRMHHGISNHWLLHCSFNSLSMSSGSTKVSCYWHFVRRMLRWAIVSFSKGQLRGKCFHVMTSYEIFTSYADQITTKIFVSKQACGSAFSYCIISVFFRRPRVQLRSSRQCHRKTRNLGWKISNLVPITTKSRPQAVPGGQFVIFGSTDETRGQGHSSHPGPTSHLHVKVSVPHQGRQPYRRHKAILRWPSEWRGYHTKFVCTIPTRHNQGALCSALWGLSNATIMVYTGYVCVLGSRPWSTYIEMGEGNWGQTPSGEDEKLEQTSGNDPSRAWKEHHRSDDRKLCYREWITGNQSIWMDEKAKQDFTYRYTKGLWTIFYRVWIQYIQVNWWT